MSKKNYPVIGLTWILTLLAILSYGNKALAYEKKDNDTTTKAVIVAKYAKDPLLNPFEITVSVDKGIVTLTGMVDTDIQFDKAVTIASSTNNVKDVNADDLQVKKSDSYIGDTLITAKIKGALLKHKIFKNDDVKLWTVSVETKDGVVYLSGTIDNTKQKRNILNIVNSVKNVRSVKEDLKIK